MAFFQPLSPETSKERCEHPCERERQAFYRGYLFGQFRMFRQDASLVGQMQRRNKTATLLKWFLLNPGKPASADEFLDLFWPDISAETALGNLHVTMHYLRRLLQPELTARQGSRFIHRRPNNFYWFEMDDTWWVDTVEIHHLFQKARTLYEHGDQNRASYYYRKIINYGSSGFLPDNVSDAWLEPYRLHYEHIYSQALQQMMKISMCRAELEDVMEYAYRALEIDPYCEPATKAIIDVHLQQGNVNAARSKLYDFCSFFQQKLGVNPDQDFQLLKDRILKAAE